MISKPVIDFTQLKEVGISYETSTGRYILSIRYLDDSKYSYAQKNYFEDDIDNCVVQLNDILKYLKIEGASVSSFNFVDNPQTNVQELSDKSIEKIVKAAGGTFLKETHNINSYEDLEVVAPDVYKVKGRNTFFEKINNKYVILFTVKRTGKVELSKDIGFSDESQGLGKNTYNIKSLLVGDNKDMITTMIIEDNKGNISYINPTDEKVIDFTLDSKDKKDNNNQANIKK